MNKSKLKEILHYDPATGTFTWRGTRANNAMAGEVAGSVSDTGYARIHLEGKNQRAHRLAFLYMTGEWPQEEIDHINGVRDDNRWINLRAVTRLENTRNTKRREDNTSGISGVYWRGDRQKWRVLIQLEGTLTHLGYFTCKLDAAAARLRAEKEHGFHANHGRTL